MKSIALLPCVAALAACSPESPFGFRLPDGDAAAGQEAFVDLRCDACHDVSGASIENLEKVAHVPLGGKTTHVRTYGELVTSIINPSHKIAPSYRVAETAPGGQSLMGNAHLNDVMTVQQLVDLVAFLETTYELTPPPAAKWATYQ